jgi:HNH endonuclease
MPRHSIVERICRTCGKTFPALRHKVARGGGLFCSWNCLWQRTDGLLVEQRFWSKVNKDGPAPEHCPELGSCWLWQGGCLSAGYGHFYLNGKSLKAHRVSWQLTNGPIPLGLWVLHRCDVPGCVRPDHLFLGDNEANQADMVSKGRQGAGARNGRAKLSEAEVLAIRAAYAAGGTSYKKLAAHYGVRPYVIWLIVKRKGWKHLGE